MSDANDNAQNGNEQQQMTISSKIIELTKALGDVDGMLRAQYEALATRNVRLPSGVLDNMRTLRRNLEALQRSATSTGMELRSLRALAENTSVVNSALDPDEVLNHVIDTVIALTGAERGYIVLKDETGDFGLSGSTRHGCQPTR
jgi:adenylate cyclase